MKLSRLFAYTIPVLLLIPALVGAQSADPDLGYVANLFAQIEQIIAEVLIPLLLALSLLLFIWGIIQFFILGAGDEEKRATGRAYMLYSIVGLVAIVAVWGLVNLLLQILGISPDAAPPAPDIPN